MLVSIRFATQRDVPALLDFIREFAAYERLAHIMTASEERLRETLFGDHPAAEVLLADCDGQSAGFAVFFGTYSTFLAQPGIYLEDLYVKPHMRGKGVGRALLQRVAAIVKERGGGRLDWRVLDWNEPAIRFYLGLGAERMQESSGYRLTGTALDRLARGNPVA